MPLGQALGLTIDTSCQRDDSSCVKKVVKGLSASTKNILIWSVVQSRFCFLLPPESVWCADHATSWEHDHLNNLAEALGASSVDNYPDDRYDLIWTDPPKYTKITKTSSEQCPGLD